MGVLVCKCVCLCVCEISCPGVRSCFLFRVFVCLSEKVCVRVRLCVFV